MHLCPRCLTQECTLTFTGEVQSRAAHPHQILVETLQLTDQSVQTNRHHSDWLLPGADHSWRFYSHVYQPPQQSHFTLTTTQKQAWIFFFLCALVSTLLLLVTLLDQSDALVFQSDNDTNQHMEGPGEALRVPVSVLEKQEQRSQIPR